MALKKPTVKSVQDLGISYKLKVSYFVASIIPIVVMTYLYLSYIAPGLDKGEGSGAGTIVPVVLVLTTFLSVLGLVLTTRAANESIKTLGSINTRMDTLLDLTKGFREGFYVDMLLDTVANAATQILNSEASFILLYDDSGALRFEYVTGGKAASLKGREARLGDGVISWAVKEGGPVMVNDVAKDKRFSIKPVGETGIKLFSFACVPLMLEGRNIGSIVVVNKQEGVPFDSHDLKILVSLADHAALSIQRARSQESSHSDFIHITELLMSAMDNHIPEMKGHARRVARYSVKLAKSMGLSEEEQKLVYLGAMLHDIGILKYSQQDYRGMAKFKLHPTLGYDMIKTVSVWRPVAPAVLSHHERFDGGGYPRGLSGEDIPLPARIISVAEVFDALVSPTSYKKPIGFDEAVKEIGNNSGTQFDPSVVDAFLAEFKREDIVE